MLKASTAIATGSGCHETKQSDLALSHDANRSISGVNVILVIRLKISISIDHSKLGENSLDSESAITFTYPGIR